MEVSWTNYPYRNTLVIRPRGKLHNELGSGFLLGVIEGPEPADDSDGVLIGRSCFLLLRHGGAGGVADEGPESLYSRVSKCPIGDLVGHHPQ